MMRKGLFLDSGGLRLVGLVLAAISGTLVLVDVYAKDGAFPVVFILATLATLAAPGFPARRTAARTHHEGRR